MPQSTRRPYPWLRSVQESGPRKHQPPGRTTHLERLAIIAVVGAVIAMAIWFFVFSGGGIGPGTV